MISTKAVESPGPFVPFGGRKGVLQDSQLNAPVPPRAEYHLEVLTPSGTTVVAIGADEELGQQSWHYPLIEDLMAAGETDVMLHEVPDDSDVWDHVMAVVPVPGWALYVILEQDKDVALALPMDFRRNLIFFGSLGFVVTLLVAWVTTRHVVKPTEELTAAAVRMAGGERSTPIQVGAQDEIGILADNLETMRQQLRDALDQVAIANQELESRVKERTRQLQDLVRRVLTAQEDERHRVALELHDETAQAISAVTIALDSVLRRRNSLAAEDTERLREARQIASDMLEGIRRLINALRPVALAEMGLDAALRWYAEDLLERSDVEVHVAAEATNMKVPDHVELALYRIGQEALNNVARHAASANVWIEIAYPEARVSLTVRDDGVGFDPENLPGDGRRVGGVGLAGMRERAALVDGVLAVDSAPGTGTTVRVEAPVAGHA